MTEGSPLSPSRAAAAAATTIKPTDLRGILKYIPRFRDQVFVIALDGAVIADDNLSNLLVDIAVLRSLSIKVVLVHGISLQLSELSEVRGVPITNADGTGVTDASTLDLAVRASSRVSHLVLEGLTQNGLKCAITNAVRALPAGVLKGVDQKRTGKVDRIDKETLHHLINANIIPIIQPIGFGPDGHTLRINSDLLAIEVAETLQATKVIYLSQQEGLSIDGQLRRDIDVAALRDVMDSSPDSIAMGSRSKALHAVKAIEAGIPRVHMVDGRIYDGLLNEIFSSEGVGTLIYGNDYQQIRQANANDVRFIHSLTRSAVKREELLHRTPEAIEANIDQFYVFEVDENIVACVTLQFYPNAPTVAELGSLYVMPFHHHRGVGRKMVEFAALRAAEKGASLLLALSTQNPTFFTSVCGFEEADKAELPESRRQVYEANGRNARILIRHLGATV
ncbi:amino-acid N-acetyltransferase [Synoicihabitans lomoniglobus]|uniref:amino-acid N-acetyltransferase n=1 Tax=Synoicihabitans lomoniglobus TaxID=2909285 RepID=A0AAF0CSU9_9BACT|nr:amino-acid N-acetyltransferase [Opitutaceae bacterium LMO-M01]WED67442.1 amino-acid N-acetyltransferase [Opitutaceae bacterium LMO-M01]